jgi:hypothetical protein
VTALANAERLAHEAIAAALRPPAPIDYLEQIPLDFRHSLRA